MPRARSGARLRSNNRHPKASLKGPPGWSKRAVPKGFFPGFGGSSNGRTADSDSACLGSNPSPPANFKSHRLDISESHLRGGWPVFQARSRAKKAWPNPSPREHSDPQDPLSNLGPHSCECHIPSSLRAGRRMALEIGLPDGARGVGHLLCGRWRMAGEISGPDWRERFRGPRFGDR